MFRNQYDSDITVWSPQGRLHQVEYALEAVKQGSAAVGLRSKTHAVLVAVKRTPGDLASYQKKLIRIDDHMGIAIAGLTSDARVISNYMRTEAMRSKMLFERPLPVGRIVSALADKAQVNTQHYGGRPYGVGLLVIGADETGPHLFECSPSGNNFEYYAMAIGSRGQSAKTYLERQYESFADAALDKLIHEGLKALQATLQQDKSLDVKNASVAYVGVDVPFTVVEGEALAPHLERLAPSRRDATSGTTTEPSAATDVAPMETE
ncbi:nucleophile aminohydrolase [Syncephalis pseudoplumigaleata]|uniref:Proteasome subunit alpha type n=1 Tax=Syncephalis pseudoplumigaleata TaxID=1712513 RepID=A0A4P9YX96_9FUNG|nr:nucleophile aminohydrolase [Syncephalis pseudoplumigaleata]|eukprot:RKP24667.1 nucleophile aminohydrolase [Syncephalis pseudoplumigaleata]